MSYEDPSVVRLAYRRVKMAAGVWDLPPIEQRIDELEVAVAESRSLEGPLAALIERVEAILVPLLDSRESRASDRDPPTS